MDDEELEAQFEDDQEVGEEESQDEGQPQKVDYDSQEVDYYGTKVKLGDVKQYVDFHRWAAANPQKWQQMQQWAVTGQGPAVPQQAAPPPVDDLEDEDDDTPPHVKLRLSGLEAGMARTAEAVAHHAAELGKEKLVSSRGLTSAQADELLQYALQNDLVAVASKRAGGNPYKAVDQALDMAYRISHFDERDKEVRTKVAGETKRKQDWRKVGFGSASPKKEAPAPKDEQDAFNRMVAEIETDMQKQFGR
jgi:hypothetical protein